MHQREFLRSQGTTGGEQRPWNLSLWYSKRAFQRFVSCLWDQYFIWKFFLADFEFLTKLLVGWCNAQLYFRRSWFNYTLSWGKSWAHGRIHCWEPDNVHTTMCSAPLCRGALGAALKFSVPHVGGAAFCSNCLSSYYFCSSCWISACVAGVLQSEEGRFVYVPAFYIKAWQSQLSEQTSLKRMSWSCLAYKFKLLL